MAFEIDSVSGHGSPSSSRKPASTVQRWWRHAMRSCQIRLDMRPRTIGNNWERTVAEEVDARYVDLVMQSMLQEFMGITVADHIRDRLLDLQVPLRPIVCLRLRQIARDE